MSVHSESEYGNPLRQQIAILRPPAVLSEAGIPSVVYAEAALSIVYHTPLDCSEQQLLVPKHYLKDAERAILSNLPYSVAAPFPEDHWNDYSIFNKDKPFAFNLDTETIILVHNNCDEAFKMGQPARILLHASSVYHFDLDDPSQTCVNPSPPSAESRHVRFPTLPAFCDTLIETLHSPPLPFIHSKFQMLLKIFLGYLTPSSSSPSSYSDADYLESQEDNSVQVLNPKYFDILRGMKEENRPYLLRSCLDVPCLLLEDSTRERELMREVRCRRMGVPYLPPTRAAPYNPLYRARGNQFPPQGPYLTPYLIPFGTTAKIEWRSLSNGASMIVKRMI